MVTSASDIELSMAEGQFGVGWHLERSRSILLAGGLCSRWSW